MQIDVTDSQSGAKKSSLELQDNVFAQRFNEPLVHQVATAYLAAARAGTHAQKTKAEVSGGGKKPWKQKGTGRARVGSNRSPLWRKGGVIFAAKPRDYSQKVNKKMYRKAMQSIWSELVRQGRLHVLESFTLEQPKTRELVGRLQQMKLESALIALEAEAIDRNLILASRNLYNVEIVDITKMDPIRLLKYEHVLTTQTAIKKVEELLA